MDYQQQWQPRTDKLLDEAFGNYVEGRDTYLYFFINDQVSGMNQGKFPVPGSIMHEKLRRTLPNRLKGFNPETTEIRLEWR